MASINQNIIATLIKHGLPENLAEDTAIIAQINDLINEHNLSYFGQFHTSDIADFFTRGDFSFGTNFDLSLNINLSKPLNIAQMAAMFWLYNYLSDSEITGVQQSVRKFNSTSEPKSSEPTKELLSQKIRESLNLLRILIFYQGRIALVGTVSGSEITCDVPVFAAVNGTVLFNNTPFTVVSKPSVKKILLDAAPEQPSGTLIYSVDFTRIRYPEISTFNVISRFGNNVPNFI